MMLHGAPTAKRTLLFSPMGTISALDLGPLHKDEREKRGQFKTVRPVTIYRVLQ